MRRSLTRFVIVGGGCAALYFALNWLLQSRLGFEPYQAALLAYVPSFILAYTLQRNWAFRASSSHANALPRYAIVQLAVGLLTSLLTQAFVYSFPHAQHIVIAGTSTIVASGVSFVLSSTWVFRKPPSCLE